MEKLKCDVCGNELDVDKQGEYAVCFNCNKMFKISGPKRKEEEKKEEVKTSYNDLICENCGHKLAVDDLAEYGVCFNCNSMFKLEKKVVKRKKKKNQKNIKLSKFQFILIALCVALFVGLSLGVNYTSHEIKTNKDTETYIDKDYHFDLTSDKTISEIIVNNMINNGEDDSVKVYFNGTIYLYEEFPTLLKQLKSKNLRIDISYKNGIVSEMFIYEIE